MRTIWLAALTACSSPAPHHAGPRDMPILYGWTASAACHEDAIREAARWWDRELGPGAFVEVGELDPANADGALLVDLSAACDQRPSQRAAASARWHWTETVGPEGTRRHLLTGARVTLWLCADAWPYDVGLALRHEIGHVLLGAAHAEDGPTSSDWGTISHALPLDQRALLAPLRRAVADAWITHD